MAKKQRPDDQLGFLAHRVAIAHQARLVLALDEKRVRVSVCTEIPPLPRALSIRRLRTGARKFESHQPDHFLLSDCAGR
jgi:hypothetical protein